MASIASPTPRRVHNSCPPILETVSPAESTASEHDSTLSESELSSFDMCSDDDEAGVFFGAHVPIERRIVASLSRTIPSSPASQHLASASGRRRSSLVNRVNTRESREFVRRKTLIHGEIEKSLDKLGSSGDRPLEGEIPHPEPAQEEWTQPEAGPSSLPIPSASTPTGEAESGGDTSDEMPSFNVEEDMFRHDMMSDDETDKENTILPDGFYGTEEEDYTLPGERQPDTQVTIGFGYKGQDGELATQIDMGGLSILDLDDPDFGPVEDTSITCDHHDLDSSDTSNGILDNPFLGSSTSSEPSVTLDNPFMTVHRWTPKKGPDVPHPVFSTEASPQPRQLATPWRTTPFRQAFPETPSEAADDAYDSELDSPIMARGPIAVPVFSVASPTPNSLTPLRGLEPGYQLAPGPPELAMALPSMDSPRSRLIPAITPRRLAPSLAPLPKTPASARPHARTPSAAQGPHVPGSLRPNRSLKASQGSENDCEADKARRRAVRSEAKAKEQAAAIRGQLDHIVSSKMSSFSPVRSPEVSQRSPQSIANFRKSVSEPIRRHHAPNTATASVPLKPLETRQPVPKLKSALKNPLLPSGIPVTRTKGSGIPRPTIKRAERAPSKVSSMPLVDPLQEVVAAAAINVPLATPVTSLKRPFSAIQSVDRPAVTTGRVGFPSRPVRDSGLHCSFGSSHGGPSFRSPGRASMFGKPVRPSTPGRSPWSTLGRPVRPTDSPTRGLAPKPARPTDSPSRSMLGKPNRPIMSPTSAPLPRHSPMRSMSDKPIRPVNSSVTAPSPAPAATPLRQPPFRPSSAQKESVRRPKIPPLGLSRNLPPPVMPRLSEARSEMADADGAGSRGEPQEDVSPDEPQEKDEPMDVDQSPKQPPAQSNDVEGSVPEADSASHANAAPDSAASGSTEDSGSVADDAKMPSPEAGPSDDTPQSSPPSVEIGRGARRSSRTRAAPKIIAPVPVRAKTKAEPVPTIVPGMSEKELRSATVRNTRRNEVYLCAIDRQIVRVPGPRPPSPSSKIPKSADREEEERKAERDARARRRQRESSVAEEEETLPQIEQVIQSLCPGDEEEYTTPTRPAKRLKLDGGEKDKFVRWNRAFTIIRGDRQTEPTPPPDGPTRSALKMDAQIPLDAQGNAFDRPIETLKRTKVAVRAVFYDGEEPAPFNYNTRAKRKK